MGEVMKLSKGQAAPKAVNGLLREMLGVGELAQPKLNFIGKLN